jgi:branched-chain amino acid transport system ATP-binding protein
MREPFDPILSVAGLTKTFGGLTAVQNLSFKSQRGKITSIIGPNGAGKSTLFNLISGILPLDAGTVILNGNDVTGWPTHRLNRSGLARSFQITNLFADLDVFENLRLGAQTLDLNTRGFLPLRHKKLAIEKAEKLMKRFDLENKARILAGTLSHGEQRRLEIAVALACEPTLLLLDEPTQGMSHGDTLETEELIKDVSSGISTMLIEHDIDMVMGISDWIVVMHQGMKLFEGKPAMVRDDPDVRKAYLGER